MLFPLPWMLVRVTGTGWEEETSAGLLALTKSSKHMRSEPMIKIPVQ